MKIKQSFLCEYSKVQMYNDKDCKTYIPTSELSWQNTISILQIFMPLLTILLLSTFLEIRD